MNLSKATPRWGIIGGGFLGMTLALRLAEQGLKVTLFEAAPTLGGLASPWQLGDIVWDRHYHVILASDTRLRALLAQFDLEHEIVWRKARTGFYVDSRLHSLSGALDYLKFPALNPLEKFRLAATLLQASRLRDWRPLEKITAVDWLRRLSGREVTRKLWIPLLRAKLGENAEQTSAAFIWATIARMYSARNTDTKSELFGYVPGGYARIIERCERELRARGIDLRVATPIVATKTLQSGQVRVDPANRPAEYFDHIVVTTPLPAAARMCADLTTDEKLNLGKVRYQGILCVSLLLAKPLSDFYITNIADERCPFTAVIEMSALVDRSHFRGRSLVYLPKYVSANSPFFEKSDDEIRNEFVAALGRMYPQFRPAHVECFQISRVRYLMPIPVLNYSQIVPSVNTSAPGLHLLNSAHILNGTLNVNETIQLAEHHAKRFAVLPRISQPAERTLAAANR